MKKINAAILGLGAIAGHMADAMRRCEGVCTYACASRSSQQKADEFAKTWGFEKAYGSYEEMLKDPQVELVYLAVPHALHEQCAMLCMSYGKHVLAEKPFAANAVQAERMIAMSHEKNLFCGEGLWSRYVPCAKAIEELCGNSPIGEIGLLTGEIGIHLSQERLFDPKLAGGALLDVGVYACSLADLVFHEPVVRVTGGALLTEQGVDETTSFQLHYESGAVASFTVSMKYANRRRGTICGTDGYIEINDVNALRGYTVCDSKGNELSSFANPICENSYLYEVESVVRSLREGRLDTPECPHDAILNRMKNLDEIRNVISLKYPFE